ncbi:MAG TPA: sigma-70 family RNA polymerase sigma factor [Vicinamibacterales bacterium]|nr:sigma-70 family RNA polymerase sigma factor [Vicinamibacterales bacterium]
MWLLAALAAVGDVEAAAADRDALARVVRGDHDALAEIYDRHARLLYSLALRILRRPTDAEDVIQEVFSQVWRQAGRYDTSRGTVVGWLVTVARSRALDRLRRDRGEPPSADIELVSRDVVDPGAMVDLQLVDAEQAARVRAALGALPETQRVPLELAYYEGLSQTAIAARLETPLGTIKTRMRQALLRLRDALAEQGR